MHKTTLKEFIEETYGTSTKGLVLVWAESYADTFIEKMKEQMGKQTFVIFVQKERIHILTIELKPKGKVTEEIAFNLGDLQDVTVKNLGAQNENKAKIIEFTAPSGELISCHVPYLVKAISHDDQKKHINTLVSLLLPTD